ncbi:DNA-binding response regulator, OmpR family, contains REC and winged-helix (wHTH) domain [Epsilonproteobacteria bacterium SCGC AD-308-P11]|nr:DNA-binding response regulator, OmpR family, contains REC and winged-helix (wHTH) domain [Epsilonproteobacteria bacterium SCGC AD-308-P11]
MKAILLEDEYLLNANIKEYLELKGMVVEAYTDGGELLEKCNLKADIAILDIEVPGATGFEVIEWIKRINSKLPAIFMTAYTDMESIRKGYSLGCSDYLKKPFNLEELWLRIQQLLDSAGHTKIELGNGLIFDLESEQLYHGNETEKLTRIQRKILKLLVENRNETVTYELLIDEVWSDFYIKSNTIASHIKEVRKFLPEGMIESVRSEGYRLNI